MRCVSSVPPAPPGGVDNVTSQQIMEVVVPHHAGVHWERAVGNTNVHLKFRWWCALMPTHVNRVRCGDKCRNMCDDTFSRTPKARELSFSHLFVAAAVGVFSLRHAFGSADGIHSADGVPQRLIIWHVALQIHHRNFIHVMV